MQRSRDSCRILMKIDISRQIFQKSQISNFMKISPVGAEFHSAGRTDRQTDMTKLICAFRSFAKAPENCHGV
jgi:hypothetical protein